MSTPADIDFRAPIKEIADHDRRRVTRRPHSRRGHPLRAAPLRKPRCREHRSPPSDRVDDQPDTLPSGHPTRFAGRGRTRQTRPGIDDPETRVNLMDTVRVNVATVRSAASVADAREHAGFPRRSRRSGRGRGRRHRDPGRLGARHQRPTPRGSAGPAPGAGSAPSGGRSGRTPVTPPLADGTAPTRARCRPPDLARGRRTCLPTA